MSTLRRGRPPLSPDGSTDVHLTIPNRIFDELDAEAKALRLSGVPELIRRKLVHLETQNRKAQEPARP